MLFHGNIESENSYGTNDLIKQGAKMVTKPEEVLEDFTTQSLQCIMYKYRRFL